MAYPQDMLPRFADYQIDMGTTNVDRSAGLVNGVLPGQTAAVTANVFAGDLVLGSSPLVNTNQPWNFTYLKYCGGYVTTAPLTADVMTGPMSGCYLCTYSQGGPKVAHIGTSHNPDHPETIAAKRSWLTFVARHDVTDVKGGSPADFFGPSDFQKVMRKNGPIPSIVGYFTGGSAYAMLIAKIPNSLNPGGNLSEVLAIKKMALQPWSSIAAMRRFRDL